MINSKKKALFPVIHAQSLAQVIKNCTIAIEAGCDGAFLINHKNDSGVRDLSFTQLLEFHQIAANEFPDFWLGVNCLDLTAVDVFQHLNPAVKGVWVDNGEIDERLNSQLAAEKIYQAKERSGWNGLYFGGVAFKYQRPVENCALAATIAQTYMDVVTTSGAGTGKAAGVDKIREMKQAIAPKPLAIASGITPKNGTAFLPWVDYFLVATGISTDFYNLDPQKTKQLADLIHAF